MSQPPDSPENSQNTLSENFALMARIKGDFSVEQLATALARVRERHVPLVRRVPEDDSKAGSYLDADAPVFPLRVLEDCGDSDWREVVSAELQIFFPDEGPAARFVLLRLKDCSDLVGVFHHWGADGMSGAYVMRDILQLLGEPDVALPPIPVQPNPLRLLPKTAMQDPRTLFRVVTSLISLRISLFFKHLRPSNAAQKTTQDQPSKEDIALRRQICLLPGSLTVAQTSALLERCRKEGTSVHAAVCVAWVIAFAHMLEQRKSWTRMVSSPVNIRKRLRQPVPDTSGPYLSIVNATADCTPGRDFWHIAREFKHNLNRESADGRLFFEQLMTVGIIFLVPKSQLYEAFGSLFTGWPDYDFSITNLGRLDFPAQNGPLRVEAFYGPLVNSMENERTLGLNTFDGRLSFTLLFRRAKMEPDRAEQLLQRATEQLARAVGW